MIVEKKIDLYAYFNLARPYPEARGYLNAFVIERSNEYTSERLRPSMIIFPGGGYAMRSDRENEPIAFSYLAKGFSVFTVEYSVTEESDKAKHPIMLIEAAMAMAYVRENANKYNLLEDKIAVIGFSAGGHLAGCISTMFDDDAVKSALKDKALLCRPDASVLCYPVITFSDCTHGGTRSNLTGIRKDKSEFTEEDLAVFDKLSVEKRVTPNTPPCFIWATYGDNAVPVRNSILMADALTLNKVPYDLHIFRQGVHGLSLCNLETSNKGAPYCLEPIAEEWFELSVKFLNQLGFTVKN